MIRHLAPVLVLLAQLGLTLGLAPLLPGLVNKVKALFAGRVGPPVFQLYYDLAKLMRKDAVISGSTTAAFLAGPAASGSMSRGGALAPRPDPRAGRRIPAGFRSLSSRPPPPKRA